MPTGKANDHYLLADSFMVRAPSLSLKILTEITMSEDLDEALKRAKAQHRKELESGKNRKDHPRLEK